MARAYHRRLLVLAFGVAACAPDPDSAPETARLGADCTTLLEAAARAHGCDPALVRLADDIRAAPDEAACRANARRLLDETPSDARVHGVYERALEQPPAPLTAAERERLLELPLPGILRVEPDLPRSPGVPATTLRVGEHAVSPSGDGTFLIHTAPGDHTLHLGHAGEQREFCVHLDACTPVELTAHGAQLARHERLSPGACGQPGLEVAAGDG